MKKIIRILGVLVCVIALSVNVVIGPYENKSYFTLSDIAHNQIANAEETPVDGYYYMIGNCIVCTPGNGSCYVSLQCCYNQEPYCPWM